MRRRQIFLSIATKKSVEERDTLENVAIEAASKLTKATGFPHEKMTILLGDHNCTKCGKTFRRGLTMHMKFCKG